MSYSTQSKTTQELVDAYPHEPMDFPQSLADYLNDQASKGLSLAAMSITDGGNRWFVFSSAASPQEPPTT